MSIDNFIESAISSLLKNPVLQVLREINISKILIQSNFIKRDIGYALFQILLHFVYMLVMNKRQSAFIRHSGNAYRKDTYYGFVQVTGESYWGLSAAALIQKVRPLQSTHY
ncbi:MAG: hypothetical protein PHH41_10415 [Sulfurimonas sp.]|nr:hypothetical protein [Sulfurimonas sp.]MDD2906331.1 hypothetical protein [Sulfurimonas sp.]MDD5203538.1 hypothetical protein [Sulfurimonas sp.]